MIRSILGITLIFFLLSCSEQSKPNIEGVVTDYYRTYQERTDFQKFLSYYDENIVLEDMILGERKIGKKAFQEFFDWENPAFSLKDTSCLYITHQIIKANEVVTQGYFTPFRWGNQEFEAMQFTSLLTFNEERKIIKQVDWINYPSNLVNYETRKNSNTWIKK